MLPEELDRFLETIYASPLAGEVQFSIKTRIGLKDPEEFHRIIRIYAKYPIPLLILHPRLRIDQYTGPVRPEAFAEASVRCPFPWPGTGTFFIPVTWSG